MVATAAARAVAQEAVAAADRPRVRPAVTRAAAASGGWTAAAARAAVALAASTVADVAHSSKSAES